MGVVNVTYLAESSSKAGARDEAMDSGLMADVDALDDEEVSSELTRGLRETKFENVATRRRDRQTRYNR